MTLLEREPALEALEGALGEVAHGEGRVALVYGEAGIGKTSLRGVRVAGRAAGAPVPHPLDGPDSFGERGRLPRNLAVRLISGSSTLI